ncbi:hypothetical protein CC79DRAFT_1196448 [Sarocladium strictum]
MSISNVMSSLMALLTPSWPLVVRLISFTCLAIGILVCLPFVLLIIYDFFLWIWRTIQKRALSKASAQQRTAVSGSTGSVQKPLSTKYD